MVIFNSLLPTMTVKLEFSAICNVTVIRVHTLIIIIDKFQTKVAKLNTLPKCPTIHYNIVDHLCYSTSEFEKVMSLQ